jgi:hypothetical protein
VKVDPFVKEIHDHAFQHCDSLVAIEFSEGLERIGRYGFSGCEILKHIHKLPSTPLKEIGAFAFEWCWLLAAIEFSEGLELIGSLAFYVPLREPVTLTILSANCSIGFMPCQCTDCATINPTIR